MDNDIATVPTQKSPEELFWALPYDVFHFYFFPYLTTHDTERLVQAFPAFRNFVSQYYLHQLGQIESTQKANVKKMIEGQDTSSFYSLTAEDCFSVKNFNPLQFLAQSPKDSYQKLSQRLYQAIVTSALLPSEYRLNSMGLMVGSELQKALGFKLTEAMCRHYLNAQLAICMAQSVKAFDAHYHCILALKPKTTVLAKLNAVLLSVAQRQGHAALVNHIMLNLSYPTFQELFSDEHKRTFLFIHGLNKNLAFYTACKMGQVNIALELLKDGAEPARLLRLDYISGHEFERRSRLFEKLACYQTEKGYAEKVTGLLKTIEAGRLTFFKSEKKTSHAQTAKKLTREIQQKNK